MQSRNPIQLPHARPANMNGSQSTAKRSSLRAMEPDCCRFKIACGFWAAGIRGTKTIFPVSATTKSGAQQTARHGCLKNRTRF